MPLLVAVSWTTNGPLRLRVLHTGQKSVGHLARRMMEPAQPCCSSPDRLSKREGLLAFSLSCSQNLVKNWCKLLHGHACFRCLVRYASEENFRWQRLHLNVFLSLNCTVKSLSFCRVLEVWGIDDGILRNSHVEIGVMGISIVPFSRIHFEFTI